MLKPSSPAYWLNRAALVFVGLVCVSAAVAVIYSAVGKDLTLDETDLAIRAHMISTAGPAGPEIYFGKGNGEAVPHPPMYDYTLALIFHLFGETETAARSLGVLCFLVVGLLMPLMMKYLLEDQTIFFRNLAIFTALCLYLINPLILQHSLLIDADATYTFLFLNLFVFFFIYFQRTRPDKIAGPRIMLAFIFALICLSKEGTPFLAAGGVLAYRLAGREWKKALLDLVFVFALGLLLAWSAWLVFCHFTGVDTMIFLRQQYAFRVSKFPFFEFLRRALRSQPVNLRWAAAWLSPAFLILTALCLARRAKQFFGTGKMELSDTCFFIGFAVWIPYQLVRPSIDMMKYQHPVYPILIAGVVCCVIRMMSGSEAGIRQAARSSAWQAILLISLAAAAGFYYYKLGDSVQHLSIPLREAVWRKFSPWLWGPLLGGLVVAGATAIIRRKFFTRSLALTCLFFIFPANLALDWQQARAEYTTAESWLNYGESGLKKTAEYLSTRLLSDTPCIMRKDILYYLSRRYGVDISQNRDPTYLFRDKPIPQAVNEFMSLPPAAYVVLDPVIMISNPYLGLLGKKVFERYTIDAKIGSFVVLRHQDYVPPQVAA